MMGRIAVFTGSITKEFPRELFHGMLPTARLLGYKLDIFAVFGSYGENYLHAEGERNVINLPSMEEYDGVILAPDTFDVKEMEKQLDLILLAKTKGPVVSIRKGKDCFYSVQIDNYRAMRLVIEHLITEHHYRRICFMKGLPELKDAQERLQAYLDVMKEYDLPVDEHMLFQGDYWRSKGAEAVEWFLSGPERPDAIACANDYMAVAVMDALLSRGINVPEEIAVTGLDDLEESRYMEPALTSIHMPSKAMGVEAVQLVDELINGKKSEQIVNLPAKLVIRRSCGCDKGERVYWTRELFRQKLYLMNVLRQNSYMNIDYEICDTFEEMFDNAFYNSFNFEYKTMYVCMCETVDASGERIQDIEHYTDYMHLRAIMSRESGMTLTDERFQRKKILPEEYRKKMPVIFVCPLHHKNRCLGYLVLEIEVRDKMEAFLQGWVQELCACMDKILLYEENQSLQEFRKLSTVDELTGLFNRRKLEQELSKRMMGSSKRKAEFFIISVDMDDLKIINDTYGHLEGDEALKSYGSILRDCTGENGLCCRVGGDEFTIVADTGKEQEVKDLIGRIEEHVKRFNELSGKPYALAGSMGYAVFKKGEELINCMKRADANMYANKVARKKQRQK